MRIDAHSKLSVLALSKYDIIIDGSEQRTSGIIPPLGQTSIYRIFHDISDCLDRWWVHITIDAAATIDFDRHGAESDCGAHENAGFEHGLVRCRRSGVEGEKIKVCKRTSSNVCMAMMYTHLVRQDIQR